MWDKQCVEAYPNQDTVIASCDPQGRYYDMWCNNEATGEVTITVSLTSELRIGPCYSIIVPMWPKSYHYTGYLPVP